MADASNSAMVQEMAWGRDLSAKNKKAAGHEAA
jgi:hypothetical protein